MNMNIRMKTEMGKQRFTAMAAVCALVFGFSVTFSGCGGDTGAGGTPVDTRVSELCIHTQIGTTGDVGAGLITKAALGSFPEGSQLSLFVTAGTPGTPYPQGSYHNVRAEYTDGRWALSPPVRLGASPAVLFAFYPYSATYTDGAGGINIYHTDQVDTMYGTHGEGQGEIHRDNPSVRLVMRHAKALLQFRIRKRDYLGEGKLTRIQVTNAEGGEALKSGATLDLATGGLTYLPQQFACAAIENPDGLYILTENFPEEENKAMEVIKTMEVMVLPTSGTGGGIRIGFVIDTQAYTCPLPGHTHWQQGTKYLYDVTFSGTQIVVEDITITPWREGAMGAIDLS